MKKADEDFVSGRENIEQKYGSLENAFDAGYEEAYQYAGYNKTKFTLLLTGWQNIHRASGYW